MNDAQEQREETCGLQEYYAQKRAKPKLLFANHRKNGGALFNVEDQQAALGALRSTDPGLKKTLALAQQALIEKDRQLAKAAVQFIGAVVQQELKGLGWSIDETSSTVQTFRSAVISITSQAAGKEAEQRMLPLIMSAFVWLTRQRELDPLDALGVLDEVFSRDRKSPSTREVSEKRTKVLVITGQRKNSLEALLTIVRPLLAKAQYAQAEIDAGVARANAANERAEKLAAELAALKEELARTQAELVETAKMKAAFEKKAEEEAVLGRIAVNRVKGEVKGFIDRRIVPLLGDAREAVKLEPPRLRIIHERVDVAISDLQGERAPWLK